MFIHVSVFLFIMEHKINFLQFKVLRKIDGKRGFLIEKITNELKQLMELHNQSSDILEKVGKTTNLQSFD